MKLDPRTLAPLALASLLLTASNAQPARAGISSDRRSTSLSSAPAPVPSDPPSAAPATIEVPLPDLPVYVQEVAKLRALPFKTSVKSGTQTPEEFRAFVERDIDLDYGVGGSACVGRALAKLGLLPEGFDLKKAYTDLLVSQAAAYYNPETKTFYVVHSDLPEEVLRPTVVHELVHALQDQQFGLGERVETLHKANNEDAENALRFLAEGEATYVMTLAALRDNGVDPGAATEQLDTALDAQATLDREAIADQIEAAKDRLGPSAAATVDAILSYPDYLFHLLLDPYTAGQRAIHRVYKQGGWAAVNALWKNPPTSTEAFLHPDQLVRGKRQEPVKVAVPDLSVALGPGYAPGCENTLGEMETEMLLEATLPGGAASPSKDSAVTVKPGGSDAGMAPTAPGGGGDSPEDDEIGLVAALEGKGPDAGAAAASPPSDPDRTARARLAAAGWGGDRYRSFEKAGGGTVVVWRTVWDTEGDAIEFNSAIRAAFATQIPKGALLPPISPEIHLWGTGTPGSPALLAVRNRKEVTFVAGATAPQARGILALLYPELAPAPGKTKS